MVSDLLGHQDGIVEELAMRQGKAMKGRRNTNRGAHKQHNLERRFRGDLFYFRGFELGE